MALQHAILVALCEQPGSGYELARRFDRSIGHFWSASHQQIYRTLASMERDGWVSVTEVAQQGRPDKKVYDVSAAGRAELAVWIAAPPSGRTNTSIDADLRDVAVKLRAAAHGDVLLLREQIEGLRAQRADLLQIYRGYAARQFPQPDRLSGSELHQYLVLRGGIRAEQSAVDWLDEVLAALAPTGARR